MAVSGRPLFQDGRNGQLKQSAVLTFMRTTLMKQGGISQKEASQFIRDTLVSNRRSYEAFRARSNSRRLQTPRRMV
jgi:hypothetical protein